MNSFDSLNIKHFLSVIDDAHQTNFFGRIVIASDFGQIIESFIVDGKSHISFERESKNSFSHRLLRLVEVLVKNKFSIKLEAGMFQIKDGCTKLSLKDLAHEFESKVIVMNKIFLLKENLAQQYQLSSTAKTCQYNCIETYFIHRIKRNIQTKMLLNESEYSLVESILCLINLEKLDIIRPYVTHPDSLEIINEKSKAQ